VRACFDSRTPLASRALLSDECIQIEHGIVAAAMTDAMKSTHMMPSRAPHAINPIPPRQQPLADPIGSALTNFFELLLALLLLQPHEQARQRKSRHVCLKRDLLACPGMHCRQHGVARV
jgi:hypothetical protein